MARSRQFNVLALLQGVVQKALERCRVSLPARVQKYDRALRRADVQPQVRQRFRDGQTQDRSPLPARPVVLPRGGGFGLWFDLREGDPVVTLVADEDARAFYETGQAHAPTFGVRHNVADAVVFPGGAPDQEQPIVNGEGEMVVGAADLTASIIFRQAVPSAPSNAGKVEVRVSVRLDLGGVTGREVARSGDGITLDALTLSAINAIAIAAGAPQLVAATGTIDDRPSAKVYSE